LRVRPDDEVYRVNTVWLGPRGLTFPWTARYVAYATWLATLLFVLLVEAATPLHVGVPPVWEICITTLFTYGVMGMVDHERPVRSVWQTLMSEVRAPRPGSVRVTLLTAKRIHVVRHRRRRRASPRRAAA